jgi:drug/metabolite transporter (DMT)-like permease
MIDILIYHLHVVAVLYAFTLRWQKEGMKSGMLAVATCGLVVTILWAMTGPIARAIMPDSRAGDFFTADTLSLVLLLIPEFFFFRAFFLRSQKLVERDA